MPISRERVEKLLTDHIARLNLPDAPKADSPEFSDAITIWKEAIDDQGYNWSELDKASRRCCRAPASFWREQLPAVLAAVELERTANFAQPVEGQSAAPSDRAAAMAASARCEWCEGTGLATIYHRDYTGEPTVLVEQPDGRMFRFIGRCVIACGCEYGRWILSRSKPEDAKRLGGFEDVQAGRTDYSGLDPTALPDRDIPQTTDWRAHVAAWSANAARATAKRRPDAPYRRDQTDY